MRMGTEKSMKMTVFWSEFEIFNWDLNIFRVMQYHNIGWLPNVPRLVNILIFEWLPNAALWFVIYGVLCMIL